MSIGKVEGATGYIDTDFEGKADAALLELENGADYVYVHVEAPDECGHRGESDNKVRAIEIIDEKVLAPVKAYLDESKEDYRILICPDHPTPLNIKTHSSDPVPYLIYDSRKTLSGADTFTEKTAAASGNFIEHGPSIMDRLLEK